MTLSEAFKKWCEAPRNMALANTYRTAIQSVLMKRYADTELCLIDEQFARNIFAGSDAAQETKSRAASILVYLLQWGGNNGHCRRPSFDYSIAREVKPADKPKGRKKPQEVIKPQKNTEDTESQSVESVESVGKTKPQITQKDTEEKIDTESLTPNPSPTGEGNAADQDICDSQKSPCESVSSVAKEESVAKPKRIIRKVDDDICQLDLRTLEVIKRFPHALRIKQELGIHNVVRAIERCGIAGGFYWTYSKDLATFRERLAARQEHNALVHADHCAQMRAAKEPQNTQKDTEKKKKRKEQAPKPAPVLASLDGSKRQSRAQTTPAPPDSGGEAAAQVNERSEEPRRSAASKALEVFTDDELFEELDRRGWLCVFTRTEVVTIGANNPPGDKKSKFVTTF